MIVGIQTSYCRRVISGDTKEERKMEGILIPVGIGIAILVALIIFTLIGAENQGQRRQLCNSHLQEGSVF